MKFLLEKLRIFKVNDEDTLEVFSEKSDREKQESDKQLDTIHMPELESEESTE